MDNNHGITRELRSFTKDPLLGYASQSQHIEQLTAIADRIDAEHESACAEAYGNGVMSVPIALDESAWVELPKDANGEYIRIGDVMEWPDGSDDPFEVVGIGADTLYYMYDDSCEWTQASTKRHYKQPTVEDVLREMADRCYADEDEPRDRDAIVAEYAAKLHEILAGDGE